MDRAKRATVAAVRSRSVPAALVVSLALAACVAGAPDRPAGAPEPPEPLGEVRYAAPAPGMVWVDGYWHWDAVDYVWIPGRWETPPAQPAP